MTCEEVLTLLDKGFTKDEILKLSEAKIPEGHEEPEEGNEPVEEGNSIPTDETTVALMKLVEETNKQNKELADTLKKMQSDNAKKDSVEVKKNLTANDVITNFIQNI